MEFESSRTLRFVLGIILIIMAFILPIESIVNSITSDTLYSALFFFMFLNIGIVFTVSAFIGGQK